MFQMGQMYLLRSPAEADRKPEKENLGRGRAKEGKKPAKKTTRSTWSFFLRTLRKNGCMTNHYFGE